jgi:hypothetical protein
MKITSQFLRVLLLALPLIAHPVQAQQSWIWSRDDHSRPINLGTDSISMVLLESRVPAGDNFIAKDNQVGLLIKTKFEGSTANETATTKEFPFMFLRTVEPDATHPKSKILSDQAILVNYFPLSDGSAVYRGITINLSLLRKQEKAGWVKVFDTLVSATNTFSLPSPLTIGMTYVNKFSTDVLNSYLPDPNKEKRIDLGAFSFLVSNNPNDLNRLTNTGLHLRLRQASSTGPGWVDPSQWSNYCFYTEFQGSNWTVKVAPKDASAPDKDEQGCSSSKYVALNNDYVPILIEAQQKTDISPVVLKHMAQLEKLSEANMEQRLQNRAADLRAAAAAHCKTYGISPKNCPIPRQ